MELEEKRLAGLQHLELAGAAGLPEVHFIRCERGELLEPGLVGDADPELHAGRSSAR